MARIAGVDIPRNKKLNIAIRYIYGMGPTNGAEAISRANVNPETRGARSDRRGDRPPA